MHFYMRLIQLFPYLTMLKDGSFVPPTFKQVVTKNGSFVVTKNGSFVIAK